MAYETFKVLIIEDNPVVQQFYKKLLQSQHYEVIVASNGEEGLRLAFTESVDVILLDILMPHMNGFEVCGRLRAAPRTADLPILMVTVLDDADARRRAMQMGADDFVTKTEPSAALDGRIKMHIKRRFLSLTRSWLADLPCGAIAENLIQAYLAANQPLAVCYLDVDGLAALNQFAGFGAGQRVLWQLARILIDLVENGAEGDYVAYYGRDDFVLLTGPSRAEALARATIQAFDGAMQAWGTGPLPGVPLTLSIGVVLIPGGRSLDLAQVHDLGRSLLRQAKVTPGSAYEVGRLTG